MVEKISIRTGAPVEGNDFYGRETELQYAWKYHISKGVSLLLLANLSVDNREMEKTATILARLLNILKNDGYLAEHNGKYIFRSLLLRDFWYNRFIK